MKIIVCVKQVPDTAEVKIDPRTNNLLREGVPSIINPFDIYAIEAALKLRDSLGGTVTLLSMGPKQAAKALEFGLEMGADRAILLSDRKLGGSDTLATGYALSSVANQLGFDIVLCGNEAIDGCTGQVGPSMAEHLGIPAFTSVQDINIDNGRAQIKRDIGSYYEVYETDLPVIACVLKKINNPRACTERNVDVEVMDANGLESNRIGLDGSPTRVASISMHEREKSYVDVDSSLSCEKRIECIINGGIKRKKTNLIRGNVKKLSRTILGDDVFRVLANLEKRWEHND